MQDYWFTSTLFKIARGEENETNPGCYGKELGNWLCCRLEEKGYEGVELLPEDWGWCVMCSQEEMYLWVGCGAVLQDNLSDNVAVDTLPDSQTIIWHVFPRVEVPISHIKSWLKNLLGGA